MPTLRTIAALTALVSSVPAQLAGVYTINPTLPASVLNFPSLLDATNALAAQGVSGPVFFWLYDDAGPFTEANPFTTANVQWAPSTAVLVMSSWTGTSATNRVTFQPAPGESPVFDATGRSMGVFWGGADYVTLQGIEIANATFDGISLYAEASHGVANDPIVDGCRVHDCGGTGVTIYGNTPNPTNTIVQNCTFWRLQLTNAGGFNTLARFGYICTRRTTNTRIVHNTFYGDTGTGSQFCLLGGVAGSATEIPYAEVSNNIFVKIAGPNAALFNIQTPATSTSPFPTVSDSNCFLDLSGGPFAKYGAGGATIALTLVDWQLAAVRDLASITGDPLFRDAPNNDYHLTALSPCNAASTLNAGVAADFDGQPRTVLIDIGADEFGAGNWTSVGTGCPGTGSQVPALRTSWPFLGSPAYTVTLDDVAPNLLTVLFGSLGLGPVAIPLGNGCSAYLDLSTTVGVGAALADAGGSASFVFSIPANPALVGFVIGYQGLVLDAASPIGFTTSNALNVVFDF